MIDFSEEFKFGVPMELPPKKELDDSVDHAPKRPDVLNESQKKLAIANSLRYFPEEWHEELAIEFSKETFKSKELAKIMVGEATAELLGDSMGLNKKGPFSLKGVGENIYAWEVEV